MEWMILVIGGIIVIFLLFKAVEYESNKQIERNNVLEQKILEIENFTISKKINGFGGFYIFAIDELNEKIAFVNEKSKKVIPFSDIIGVELIEDGSIISKKSTVRTIGGAIVGGVLAGGAGTIVGGLSGNSSNKNKVSSLSVKILLRNIDNPSIVITCFDSRTMTTERKSSIETDGKMESYIYKAGKKNADEIKDLISVIIDRFDNTLTNSNVKENYNSVADELIKLNELKEKGILTENEFLQQKNKIINK